MVSNEGHALLGDFGSSHFAQASFNTAVEQRLGGTLNWMAPEYIGMKEFKMTTAGDVWAFGMTTLVSHLTTLPLTALSSVSAGVVHQEAPI